MKTIKKVPIEPVFVEYIPETLEQDKIYISPDQVCALFIFACVVVGSWW